jgi:hypothetical protein
VLSSCDGWSATASSTGGGGGAAQRVGAGVVVA